jgi:predicted membrane protein
MLEIDNKHPVTEMKVRNIYRIIIGALMLISGLVYIAFISGESIIGIILLVAGLAFLITGITRHRKDGDSPESDERSKKIGAYGLSYAWLTGIFFMFGLFWLDYLNIVKLSTQIALALSIVVLALSGRIYQLYLFRKGDIE